MNENGQADIPGRLRRLRPVAAPPQLETIVHQKIRALRPGNRYLAWFTRPVPVALMVGVGALLVAAYFLFSYPFSPPSSVTGDGVNEVPPIHRIGPFPPQNQPEGGQVRAPLLADSL